MPEQVGLAKSAESVEAPKPIVHKDLPSVSAASQKEAPYDVYAMFSTDPFKAEMADKAKLLEIYEYATSKVPEAYRTEGNIMLKLSELKNKVGAPSLDERSFTKLHTYVRLAKSAEDIHKRMEALRG